MLCHRGSSKRSSIRSILVVHPDHADIVRGIHRTNFMEHIGADQGEALEDSFIVVVNFHGNVFSSPCRVEKRGVMMVTANGGSVKGVGNGLALAERREGLREGLRHLRGLCLIEIYFVNCSSAWSIYLIPDE